MSGYFLLARTISINLGKANMILCIAFFAVIILSLYAQFKVNSTFEKYSKVGSRRGYTADEVARQILMSAGITDVRIEPVRGNLTDHYDPTNKILRLSEAVYGSRSIAAIGVAAHETGHAIQHSEGYAPLSIRNSIFPIVSLGSKLAMPLIFLGCFFYFFKFSLILLEIGAILFAVVVAFYIITLPMEFNASNRAVKLLGQYSFLDNDELKAVKKVLGAAALTYVASAAAAVIQLLRILLMILGRGGSRRD